MLAFPGVIYSQPLYFEWLSPQYRRGYQGTERRERDRKTQAVERGSNGMSNRREREAEPLRIRLTGWRVAEGVRRPGWGSKEGNSGWLAGFYYWQLDSNAYCFPFYLLYGLWLLFALLRFTCTNAHECICVSVCVIRFGVFTKVNDGYAECLIEASAVDRFVINVSLINSMFCLSFCILKFTIKKKDLIKKTKRMWLRCGKQRNHMRDMKLTWIRVIFSYRLISVKN